VRHPLLYEINTRCWLRELSESAGQQLSLSNVPAREFQKWQQLGLTHIWLMGVWKTGRQARRHACRWMSKAPRDAAPTRWTKEDLAGSPYAIAEYQVSDALGGDSALRAFRGQLHRHGLKLILDFVPNHLGLDHPWIRSRPSLFVQAETFRRETLRVRTTSGHRWMAYGKDPHFPAWSDTVQLDYRKRETRWAMMEVLRTVSRRCDGVRCDMAMLLLNEVFGQTWKEFPCLPAESLPKTEFWTGAIRSVKEWMPEFLFVGEVYWGLEERLQQLGFDYTYDKRLYDHVVARDHAAAQRHLLEMAPSCLERSIHFLENHDEPRIASLLSLPELRAATWLILSLPGMCLLHEGQLTGARNLCPVQLSRRTPEPVDADLVGIYSQLLSVIRTSTVRKGRATVLRPRVHPNARDDGFAIGVIAVLWCPEFGEGETFEVAVLNLTSEQRSGWITLPVPGLDERDWRITGRIEGCARTCSGLIYSGLEWVWSWWHTKRSSSVSRRLDEIGMEAFACRSTCG
jgi:hypothetical protein